MTPIEKNVIVVDESGNEYGATWPKRARGLVKSGRARFIDENRICLACPPNINEITEDIKMSENKKIEAAEAVENTEIAEATENTATKYTIDYVLEQIAKLQQQITESSYYSLHRLSDAVYSIYGNDSESDGSDESEESRNDSVSCVCEIFRYREVTLQKMLAFYEKMYDDLKPSTAVNKQERIALLLKALSECVNDSAACYMADELRRLMEDK